MKIKKYLLSDFFDISTTKSVDKNKIEFKNNAPYDFIGRTSTDWGVQGTVEKLDFAPNPKDSFSLVQVGETVALWREKEWYASQNLFLLKPKVSKIKDTFLYFQAVINKEMSSYGNAYNSYPTMKSLNKTNIFLPVTTKYIPDFESLEILAGGGTDMSNIDTSSWKEFKLDEILQKVNTVKIPLKKGDCPTIPTATYIIPARTATVSNQGLSCYVPVDSCTVLKNKISVSANGDFCAFWHDSNFTILQDAYALEGKGFELTEKIALFLISIMTHSFSQKYNWNNKAGWEKLRNETIKLPVKESEEIDWDYMQERIAELEQERIAELEQERIAELEQYLIATGLNDYELTDKDKEILATKLMDGGALQSSTSVNGCLKEARMFRVGDLFELQKVSNKLAKENLSDEYEYPTYSSDTRNNGIIGYTDNPEFICDDTTPVYITFGDHTRTFNIARKSFSVLDNVKVLIPCCDNDEVLLYLMSVWHKQIPNLGYARHWKVAKGGTLSLPIQTDSQNNPIIDSAHTYHPQGFIPDWEYMEKYIKATEKVVIQDVVDWKDEMIEKTKEVVDCSDASQDIQPSDAQ